MCVGYLVDGGCVLSLDNSGGAAGGAAATVLRCSKTG